MRFNDRCGTCLGFILMEEMALCAQDPLVVNALLLRPNWGSGRLVRCTSDGEAVFKRAAFRSCSICFERFFTFLSPIFNDFHGFSWFFIVFYMVFYMDVHRFQGPTGDPTSWPRADRGGDDALHGRSRGALRPHRHPGLRPTAMPRIALAYQATRLFRGVSGAILIYSDGFCLVFERFLIGFQLVFNDLLNVFKAFRWFT